jgi:succinate dehydrogenase hydrophobic anchor subunit
MKHAEVFKKSVSGSDDWIKEKFAKIIFLPSSLYVFVFFLLSYKLTHVSFYLNLFFTSLLNVSALILMLSSGLLLAYIRFKAILNDYVKCSHLKLLLRILFIAFNTFFFTFTVLSFIYFNFIISISTL